MKQNKYFENPTKSYWIESTPTTDYPSLECDLKTDVAIIGGGFAGISCAYMLAKAGVETAILEAGRILQGTTAHTTAKVTSQHDLIYSKIIKDMGEEPARQYAEANETAIREIERLADEYGIECDFEPQNAYIYTLQDKYAEKIYEEEKAASSLGIKASCPEKIPLPFQVKAALRFENQAQFHPRKFLLPLAKKVIEMGGLIFENSRAVNIEDEDNYIIITNKGRKITARKLIIASHYPCYNKTGMYFTRIYTERAYVLAIRAKEKYPGGMYISAEEPVRSLRNQQTENGELIFVVGESHKTGQGGDTAKHYDNLANFANSNYTVENIPYRWSTQDCMTMDGLPLVGEFSSKTPNLYLASGFGKWGMTNSMVSAMILSDLIIKGRSPWQEVYDPNRGNILASAKSFVVENLNVAEKLIESNIKPATQENDISPGEGKTIEVDGQKSKAYRDEQGELHVIDPTCTHMGCELSWNSAEKTWDCPCHGSRFSLNGEIIEGPTVNPLNVYKDTNTIEKLFKDNY